MSYLWGGGRWSGGWGKKHHSVALLRMQGHNNTCSMEWRSTVWRSLAYHGTELRSMAQLSMS
eukprot:7993999-Pyramimonas_sp.AAC.1